MPEPDRLKRLEWLGNAMRELQQHERNSRNFNLVFDASKQASVLDKELPRDLNWLMSMIQNPLVPIEHRARLLEVVILRGANNEVSYAGMGSYERWREETKAAFRGSSKDELQWVQENGDDFEERRRYQEAARDAIMRSPEGAALFNQLSRTSDQLPPGRTGATEFMNTMLRNGGLHGSDESRQVFEKAILNLRAETRGRMMYHLEEAGGSSDIHLKGERRPTGDYQEVGVQVSAEAEGVGVSAGVTWGQQWGYVADNHWKEAGKDISKAVNSHLHSKKLLDPDEITAFHKGYEEAAWPDKPPDKSPSAPN